MTDQPEDRLQTTWVERFVWIPIDRFATSPRGRRFVPDRLRMAAMGRASLPGWRAMDREQNRKGRMPDDEAICLRAIWISEAYPPSHLASLIQGLEALGVSQRSGGDSAAEYVRRYRGSPSGSASYNLGWFTRPAEAAFQSVDVDLPRFVGRARGWLENVTPSLTVVTMQFEIADASVRVLEAPLRAEYRTTASRMRRGWTFHRPDQRRREAMDIAVARMTRECSDWVRRYFPGAFSAGIMGGDFPSCLFLTTRQMVPFDEVPPRIAWPFGTGLDKDHESWDSVDWPGLRLRVPDDEQRQSQWWLSGREGDFLRANEELQDAFGGANPAGWVNRISDEMCLSLSPLATWLLLRTMHEEVARSRDAMGGDRWDFGRLDVLRRDVTTFVRDIEPVARDLSSHRWTVRTTFKPGPGHILTRIAEHDAARKAAEPPATRPSFLNRIHRALAPVPATAQPAPSEGPPMLANYMADDIRFRADALLDAGRQHRDALAVVSTLVAASESYRLDRRLLWMTAVFGLVAVASTVVAIISLNQ